MSPAIDCMFCIAVVVSHLISSVEWGNSAPIGLKDLQKWQQFNVVSLIMLLFGSLLCPCIVVGYIEAVLVVTLHCF